MVQFKLGNFLKGEGGKCTNQQYLLQGNCTTCPEKYYCDSVTKTLCATNEYCPEGTPKKTNGLDGSGPETCMDPKPFVSYAVAAAGGTGTKRGCISCNGNWNGADSTCALCEAGKYYDSTAAEKCTACSKNTYQNKVGQTGCKDCPPGSTITSNVREARTDCKCGLGLEKTGNDDTFMCPSKTCDTNQWLDKWSGECVSCGPNMVVNATGTGCECKAHFPSGQISGVQCQCGKGDYLNNNQECKGCPGSTTSDKGATSINDCYCPAAGAATLTYSDTQWVSASQNSNKVCYSGGHGSFSKSECKNKLIDLKNNASNKDKVLFGTWLKANNSCRYGVGANEGDAQTNCDNKSWYLCATNDQCSTITLDHSLT